MSRRRAARIGRVRSKLLQAREEDRDMLISRRDVLAMMEAYDRDFVAEWRGVTDFLAMPWWRRVAFVWADRLGRWRAWLAAKWPSRKEEIHADV